jgi:hypothetical protein
MAEFLHDIERARLYDLLDELGPQGGDAAAALDGSRHRRAPGT